MDDSLLFDVMKEGKADTRVLTRMCSYFLAAEEAQAQTAVNACSTVSETVGISRSLVNIPIVRIDEPMAKLAVNKEKNIGMIATVPTTLDYTSALIERKTKEVGKKVSLKS